MSLGMIGSDAFEYLSAEYEREWLASVYVDPAEMAAFASIRSMIIAGESGSGKSALRLMLTKRSPGADGPERLAVEWRFAPSFQPLHGSRLVQAYADQVLAACAETLLGAIGRWPHRFAAAHAWVQEAALEFIRRMLGAALGRTAARIERECPPEGAAILAVLQQASGGEPSIDHVPDAIFELSAIVQDLGMAGIWVLVDRLEPWVGADADQVAEAFRSMLETLTLFEAPGFAFKIFAPPELAIRLTGVTGVGRRRLDVLRLTWGEADLTAIANARLRLALGNARGALDTLVASALLGDRLRDYGGRNPRGWLELLRPFVEVCQGVDLPLSAEQFATIHERHPPFLRIDLRTDQVYLGEQELIELQPSARRLLHYLYQNHERIVPRAELYYCGQRNLPEVPAGAEEGWDGSPEWTSKLDTALWRLRKQVEPDPQTPRYIITTPTGVRLANIR